jgi:hypothetical protein
LIPNFERFVGIDWSGARGLGQSGIQVAELNRGEAGPVLRCPKDGILWSRPQILKYLHTLIGRPTLVGVDFAFSVPWPNDNQLFSAGPAISDAKSLWKYVEHICQADDLYMYGGSVWKSEASAFRPYIHHYATRHFGEFYRRNMLRRTEMASPGKPISVYHMTGVQVGASSFSGMRLLNALRDMDMEKYAVWPFDDISDASLVVVEIYPSFFYRRNKFDRARLSRLRKSKIDEFFDYREDVLNSYGTVSSESDRVPSVDAADAMISCAALAEIARDENCFGLPASKKALIQREGWIFGVPFESGMKS